MFKKIINHSFWLLAGNSMGRLAMFLTNIIAARILPQEIFGQFAMVRNTISSIGGILSGTLGSISIKRVSELFHREKETVQNIISTIFIINITIASILSLFLFVLAPNISKYFFFSNSTMTIGLYIGSLLLIATILSNTMQTLLTGFEEFKKLAFASIGASLVSFPIIILLIYYFHFYGAIFAVVLYFTMDFLGKYFQFRTHGFHLFYFYNPNAIWLESKKLLKFSTPLFLSVLITTLSFWYARVIVINTSGGFEKIAIFDAAYQWLTIIMIITGATTSVALPMLSKAFIHNKYSDISKMFWLHLSINLGISIGMALLFALFSQQIMHLYGESYIKGYKILIILCVTSVFFTISSLLNKSIIVRGNFWSVFISSSLGALTLFTVLNIYINLGIYALAFGLLAFYIASASSYSVILIKMANHE